jgi:hypothetical protein
VKVDSIVLGASPIAVVEAFVRSITGESVVLVDKCLSIGGVWKTMDIGFLGNIETAPHLVEPSEQIVYQFIQDYLGCPMIRQSPEPFFLYKGLRFNAASPFQRALLKLLSRGFSFPNIEQFVRSIFARRLDYYYFAEGSGGLVKVLENLLRESSVRYIPGTCLNSVSINSKTMLLSARLSTGVSLDARALIITNGFELESILVDGEHRLLPASADMRVVRCCIFVIKSQSTVNFTYIKFIDNNILDRVSDITKFVKGLPVGHRVLVVQLAKDSLAMPAENDSVTEIFNALASAKIINLAAEIVKIEWCESTVSGFSRGDKEMDTIESQYSPFIRVLNTRVLSPNMAIHIPRWIGALDTLNKMLTESVEPTRG